MAIGRFAARLEGPKTQHLTGILRFIRGRYLILEDPSCHSFKGDWWVPPLIQTISSCNMLTDALTSRFHIVRIHSVLLHSRTP